MRDFSEIKRTFKKAFVEIVQNQSDLLTDEAAFPAYAHKNPLIDRLFWKRLRIAYDEVGDGQPKRILDFGCGSGVLSYALAKRNHQVTAVDVEFKPLELIKQRISFPDSIEFIEGDILNFDLEKNSFDYIIALDVLEHIDDLNVYLGAFSNLLDKDGSIIVSGPTENILYQIGRQLAGDRFSGDYHVSNIAKIRQEFTNHFQVQILSKVLYPFTLFELFLAKQKVH